jgi:hypothetical protein
MRRTALMTIVVVVTVLLTACYPSPAGSCNPPPGEHCVRAADGGGFGR